jgi:hypothetical protein
MGFWPLWKYQEYVERYAQGGDRHTLGSPYSEPLGELGGDTYPRIRLGYFSMPRWMDTFDKSIGEDDMSFRRLRFHYLSDRNDYLLDLRRVISTIHQWKTGKLLLKEIAATRAFLRIIPNWVFWQCRARRWWGRKCVDILLLVLVRREKPRRHTRSAA